MTSPLAPNSDLVATGWLKLYQPISASGVIVATSLPKDNAKLREIGAIRTRIVGGSPDLDVPFRRPVISCECWAAPAEGSQKLPWNQAAALAEWCWEASYNRSLMMRTVNVTLGGVVYAPAMVHTVEAVSEPVRVETDPNFARFDVDLLLNWTRGVLK